jgi:hypothetical protein
MKFLEGHQKKNVIIVGRKLLRGWVKNALIAIFN